MERTDTHHRAVPQRARRVTALLLVLVGLSVVLAPVAEAGRQWCRSDPVVTIDNHIADIFVSAPLTAPLKVTGPNRIVVLVPEGVPAALVASTIGFGLGEEVSFRESRELRKTRNGTEIAVRVYVPATVNMPITVEFALDVVGVLAPKLKEGTANTWVTLRATI